jgi:hypothetical protein
MKKYAVPAAIIPGAIKQIDPDTRMPVLDDQGRYVWDMSKAKISSHAIHDGVVREGKKTVRKKITVPAYRALSAQDARYIRSQIKRLRKKQLEQRTADMKAKNEEKNSGTE